MGTQGFSTLSLFPLHCGATPGHFLTLREIPFRYAAPSYFLFYFPVLFHGPTLAFTHFEPLVFLSILTNFQSPSDSGGEELLSPRPPLLFFYRFVSKETQLKPERFFLVIPPSDSGLYGPRYFLFHSYFFPSSFFFPLVFSIFRFLRNLTRAYFTPSTHLSSIGLSDLFYVVRNFEAQARGVSIFQILADFPQFLAHFSDFWPVFF